MSNPTAPGDSLASAADVLLVDDSADSLEVLSTMLRRRGLTAIGTRTAADGLRMARTGHPRVIVLDEDLADRDGGMCHAYQAAAKEKDAYLMVLCSVRRQEGSPIIEKIVKPYHYGALIRRIEGLFEDTKRAA